MATIPPTPDLGPEVVEAQDEVEALRDQAAQAQAVADGDAKAEPADPPVYDERGNVRPRGTKGARPMTLAQRKAIARKLQS